MTTDLYTFLEFVLERGYNVNYISYIQYSKFLFIGNNYISRILHTFSFNTNQEGLDSVTTWIGSLAIVVCLLPLVCCVATFVNKKVSLSKETNINRLY